MRVLQGVGGAMLMASSSAILTVAPGVRGVGSVGAFGTAWAYLMLRDLGERRPARLDWRGTPPSPWA